MWIHVDSWHEIISIISQWLKNGIKQQILLGHHESQDNLLDEFGPGDRRVLIYSLCLCFPSDSGGIYGSYSICYGEEWRGIPETVMTAPGKGNIHPGLVISLTSSWTMQLNVRKLWSKVFQPSKSLLLFFKTFLEVLEGTGGPEETTEFGTKRHSHESVFYSILSL